MYINIRQLLKINKRIDCIMCKVTNDTALDFVSAFDIRHNGDILLIQTRCLGCGIYFDVEIDLSNITAVSRYQ